MAGEQSRRRRPAKASADAYPTAPDAIPAKCSRVDIIVAEKEHLGTCCLSPESMDGVSPPFHFDAVLFPTPPPGRDGQSAQEECASCVPPYHLVLPQPPEFDDLFDAAASEDILT